MRLDLCITVDEILRVNLVVSDFKKHPDLRGYWSHVDLDAFICGGWRNSPGECRLVASMVGEWLMHADSR